MNRSLSEKQACSRQREQQEQRHRGAQAPLQVLVLGRPAWPAREKVEGGRQPSLEGQMNEVANAMLRHLEAVAELQSSWNIQGGLRKLGDDIGKKSKSNAVF